MSWNLSSIDRDDDADPEPRASECYSCGMYGVHSGDFCEQCHDEGGCDCAPYACPTVEATEQRDPAAGAFRVEAGPQCDSCGLPALVGCDDDCAARAAAKEGA